MVVWHHRHKLSRFLFRPGTWLSPQKSEKVEYVDIDECPQVKVRVSLGRSSYCAGDVVYGTVTCELPEGAPDDEFQLSLQLHGHLRVETKWLALSKPLRSLYGQTEHQAFLPPFSEFMSDNTACIFTTPRIQLTEEALSLTSHIHKQSIIPPPPPPTFSSSASIPEDQEEATNGVPATPPTRVWKRAFAMDLPKALLPSFRGFGAKVFYLASVSVHHTGTRGSSHVHLPFSVIAVGYPPESVLKAKSLAFAAVHLANPCADLAAAKPAASLSFANWNLLNRIVDDVEDDQPSTDSPIPAPSHLRASTTSSMPTSLSAVSLADTPPLSYSSFLSRTRPHLLESDSRPSLTPSLSFPSLTSIQSAPSYTSVGHPMTPESTHTVYTIRTAGGEVVGYLILHKKSFAPGDIVLVTFDLASQGSTRCVQLAVSLVMQETYRDMPTNEGDGTARPEQKGVYPTIVDVYHEYLHQCHQTSFTVRLPLDAPPTFHSALISLAWLLKFEFTVQTSPPSINGHASTSPPRSSAPPKTSILKWNTNLDVGMPHPVPAEAPGRASGRRLAFRYVDDRGHGRSGAYALREVE